MNARTIVLAMLLGAAALGAQERLVGIRRAELGPVYERWSFADALPQAGASGAAIASASQLSVPITALVPLGERWTFDLYGAYASGTVTLDSADAAGRRGYDLSGLTDMRLRLTGRLLGDAVMLTFGARIPTGRTELDSVEFEALRVLAAPALRFQTSSLGGGAGATTGLVVARQFAGWAWALATSYEMRGSYAPVDADVLGVRVEELNPGDVVHLSLGSDGLVGPHRTSLALTADFYTRDQVRTGSGEREYRLGSTLTAEWQLQLAAPRFRELSAYTVTRYRSKFTRPNGEKAPGSSGTETEAGVMGVVPWTRALALVVGLDGRYHTGLKVDNSVATAAMASGGGTLGLAWGGGAATLTPYLRAQAGRLDTGGFGTSAIGLSGGLTLGTRF